MKKIDGWLFPDHEIHLPEWMAMPKNRLVLNGRQAYQGKKQLALLNLCPPARRHTFVDVGGHIGLWSFNFAFWFQTVEAFEPVVEHQDLWLSNMEDACKENPNKRLSLNFNALGDSNGIVKITTPKGSSGNSHVTSAADSSLAADKIVVRQEGRDIEIKKLDDFTKHSIRYVDAIKIDCEGYELNVLKGAVETIKEWKPTIVVEQKRDMADQYGLPRLGAVEFLRSLDYRLANEISGDYFMVPNKPSIVPR